MTIWEWLTVLLRRWPVLVIGLLCTAVAVYLVHKRPIVYQSCGDVIMAPPKSHQHPNIYTNLQASLVDSTGLIATQLMSTQMQQHFRAQGLTADYQAQVHNTGTSETPSYGEPEMDVCSSSYDSAMALSTTEAVLKEFGAVLHQRQVAAHITPRYGAAAALIAGPGSLPVLGHPSQAYLGVAVIGFTCTVVIALWIDPFLRRRARRRRAARRAAARAQGGGQRDPASPWDPLPRR